MYPRFRSLKLLIACCGVDLNLSVNNLECILQKVGALSLVLDFRMYQVATKHLHYMYIILSLLTTALARKVTV